MIKRIMNKLFSDELLQHFSYSGKSGKKLKFSNLAVCSVILGKIIYKMALHLMIIDIYNTHL